VALGLTVGAVATISFFITVPVFFSPAHACSGGGGDSDGGGSSDGSGSDEGNAGDPTSAPIGFGQSTVKITSTANSSSGPISNEIQDIIKKVNKLQQEYQALLKDMRPGDVKSQARHEKEAKQHQLNADLYTIAKYGLHVFLFSHGLKGMFGPDLTKAASPAAKYFAIGSTAHGNKGLAQSAVDLVKAADAAVKATISIYSAATAPERK
jgi:hypothetical protein